MTDDSRVSEYTDAVKKQFVSGHAREHAYRPALERLMDGFEDVTAVNDPKRSKHGNPDFVFVKQSNKDITFGYAEAKDITINLAKTVKTEQLRRYAGYEKLFLTNYLDFRFFRNGDQYEEVSIGKIKNGELVFSTSEFARLQDVLQEFLNQAPETIRSGKRLALIMGGKARRIRDNVRIYLRHEDNEQNAELEKIYNMMKELLVHDLTPEKFADMYAQTLVYGLFVARYNDKSPGSFTRKEARDLVPASNPFLQEFFDHIVGPHFDKRLSHIVDELCEAFGASDVHVLVQKHLRLFKIENDKDPIIHFYEDFLKEYNPDERKKMGAYYTPVPVVRFIIRQVDDILKRDFGLTKGLADTSKIEHAVKDSGGKKYKFSTHKVQILDPAVGTATFLNETIKYIYKSFKGQEGRWPAYAEQDLIPRLYGFELMMAPYTIAHLKLSMTLQETGIKEFKQRLGVYLTNTLEEGVKHQQDLFTFGLAQAVSDEAEEAAKIKHERPIMVIIGNPPYSGVSSNETEYANQLVSKYKVEPGGTQKLKERKHWLNDDYVKFIAFAEDMIDKNGEGIVAMITNHGYLDNPTFRGMRWHLAKTFDSINILDLHGNTLKKEVSPDGSKDENVFDIQQGVAILLAVKINRKRAARPFKVKHSELYGTRRYKFDQLLNAKPNWRELILDPHMYFFTNKNIDGQDEYEKGIKIDELFIKNVSGIVTARDKVVIDEDHNNLIARMQRISDFQYSDDETRSWLFPKKISGKYLAGDSRGWKLITARKVIKGHDMPSLMKKITYRPFDTRWIYYSPAMVDWGRFDLMPSMLNENMALVVNKAYRGYEYQHVLVADNLIDFHLLETANANPYVFPLYLYHSNGTRTVNLKESVLKQFVKNLKQGYESEEILDYIYASLYSPQYRETYKEFLKSDFPRVPKPKNDEHFHGLASYGKRLRKLHLMTSHALDNLITTFPVPGSNVVEKVNYDSEKVWINDIQYFGSVPENIWSFYIGGYQPARKWLKDRKGRKLSNEDIDHYQKIITALVKTNEIMQKVDNNEGL